MKKGTKITCIILGRKKLKYYVKNFEENIIEL